MPNDAKHESCAGHLAELETAGWKDDRRFRLLTVDRGALSFSDLYFNTPTKVRMRCTAGLQVMYSSWDKGSGHAIACLPSFSCGCLVQRTRHRVESSTQSYNVEMVLHICGDSDSRRHESILSAVIT